MSSDRFVTPACAYFQSRDYYVKAILSSLTTPIGESGFVFWEPKSEWRAQYWGEGEQLANYVTAGHPVAHLLN
jgi:hypothetical protein